MVDDESLEAKIKLSLIEIVESRIQSRFESDRTFIRETVGAAVKILTIALTVVMVILTLFGIKTISDIDDVIIESTRDEISKRLDKSNPTVKYAAELETLYNKVLINDLDLRIRSNTNVSRQIRVSNEELERIIATLEQAETQNEIFRLGARVLTRTATEVQWEPISKKFRAMVSAKDPYRWLIESDSKRIALIYALLNRADSQSFGAIRGIATDKDATKSLRRAAIGFIGLMGGSDSADMLESLSIDSDYILKIAAILSLAKVDPSSDVVKKWVEGINLNSDISYLSNAFELIDSLREGISNNFPTATTAENRKAAEELIIRIFERLSNSGVALRFLPDSGVRTISTSLVAYRLKSPLSFFTIPVSSVFSYESSRALSELLKRAVRASDEEQLKSLVSLLTIDWKDTAHVGAAVHVELSGDSRIEIESGPSLTTETLPSGAILLARTNESASPVRAFWSDATGIVTSRTVISIYGVDGVKFSVKRADHFGYVFLPMR